MAAANDYAPPANPIIGQRINVVGTSGSGKTTLAQRLSRQLGLPHVELDALYWGPNWTEPQPDVFRQQVAEALSRPRWVVDGNYSLVRGIVWGRADTVVWLDYPLSLVLWQITRRTVRRAARQEELWQGNREEWRRLFSRESMIVWVLQTYRRRRRQYQALFADPTHAHLIKMRLRAPRDTEAWLSALTPPLATDHPPLTTNH